MLYLASASPRRAELLAQAGLPFEAMASKVVEQRGARESAEAYVRRLAFEKALEVRERLRAKGLRKGQVLGADTVVVLGAKVLEKPKDAREAKAMLAALAGREHRVLTGVALLPMGSGKPKRHVESTKVRFRKLTRMEISAYVATGEPRDKAGAYGIQGRAGAFVSGITGCYYNVVGLPLARVVQMLGTKQV